MYRFVFDIDYRRSIPAVMIDARAGTPLANQIGSVIKGYTDAAVAAVGPFTIPYKIEVNHRGNLVGIFTLNVNGTGKIATLGQFVLRPAFQVDNSAILAQIVNFIQTNGFAPDFLS
jgi:hypothetical protein